MHAGFDRATNNKISIMFHVLRSKKATTTRKQNEYANETEREKDRGRTSEKKELEQKSATNQCNERCQLHLN